MQLHWLFLAGAIISEVFASSMLKLSEGFSKPLPMLGMTIGFIISFYFLSLALKTMPLGTAYAVWAGLGLVLTSVVSVVFFGQKTDFIGIVSIALILLGVVLLNSMSQMSGH
ncbi:MULTISPECIES: multidrug efflux SMR transporter [unclassified Pasteurella]|uniref:DMT family transporter n=1 Tax=unclassified Pasteurella TaxID=2621516 RepID=UPI0010738A7C|nr:multidrug efflux SMR transporter [Pasteurella sp. 19428wF3_WM03]TFU52607.1 multidrug efflux SMR transporter [Pasteurella sp. WM03]